MTTLADLLSATGAEVYDHLVTDIEVPVRTGPVSQGDVRFRPLATATGIRLRPHAPWSPVPREGLVLVAGAHSHTLHAGTGDATWTTAVVDPERLAVGVVDATAVVHVLHPEHGALALAPGRWLVRRQREQAEVARLVAD